MKSMQSARHRHGQRSSTFLAAMLAAGSVLAQTTVYSEQDKLTRGSRDVATLGADLFGDQVSMYNGNIEFRQTDVSLPGNNSLSVAIGRRLAGSTEVRLAGLFDDWDLDIPHLHGVFKNASGWVTNSGTQSRCSGYGPPDTGYYQGGTWDPNEYWHGSFIYLPGQGSQEILTRSGTNPNYPSDGNAWPLTTQSMVSIRCLSTMARGAGEGFIAVTPDGTQYRFDWMVSRSYPSVSKPGPTSEGLTAGSASKAAAGTGSRAAIGLPTPNVAVNYILARQEVWILPTQVTDRHGNTVTYAYDAAKPWRLTSITSSDGRSIALTYDGTSNRVASVYDGTRTWTYTYSNGLNRVTQPDGAQWQFAMSGFTQAPPMYTGSPSCDNEGYLGGGTIGSMTHPSGAVGTFNIAPTSHGRSFVVRECRGDPSYGDYAVYPRYMASRSLKTKAITGPGLDSMTWTYTYSASSAAASWDTCTGTCLDYKTVEVVDPRNVLTRYTFGNRYRVTEGQLQKVEVGPVGGSVLRTTTMHYRDPAAGPYPSAPGISPQRRGNGELASRYAPQDQRVITQQGKTFTWQAQSSSFDTKARAQVVTKNSDLNPAYSRTETTVYRDIGTKWVLGLLERVTESSTGAVPVYNTYDLANGNLLSSSRFGKLQVSYSYYPGDGTLWTAKDGLNHVTTFSNYQRGLAQNIAYADGKSASAVVHNIGVITSLTNEVFKTTTYGYDSMGRLASISHPSEPLGSYNVTTLSFAPVNALESGLPAGHWRQTITTGAGTVTNLFDGLWRKRVTYSTASGAVASAQLMHYDADGRVRFQSYPLGAVPSITDAPAGTSTSYESLGRVSLRTQDTELSPSQRTSSTSYLAGFQTQTSDFNGNVSTSAFQAFDSPSEDALASLAGPEGLNLVINRDVFGKPLSITRYGTSAGIYTSVTRSYVYDINHLLCKTIEPELGATLQDWDAAGNLAWRTGGTGLSGNTCDRSSVSAAQQISFGYDARNRLTSTGFGDGSPGITRTYTDDGLPYQVISDGSTWTYGYSNRRLLISETLNFGGVNYGIVRGYNANGHLNELTYPDGTLMAYAPDALGRPAQVGAFATGITYRSNGAVQGYTYGSGVVHSLTQNLRGLPQVMTDVGRVSDQYAYDANGNVTGSPICRRASPRAR
jgi:YD repeat-containing protein